MVLATTPQPAIDGRHSVLFAASGGSVVAGKSNYHTTPRAPRLTDPPARRPSINATNGTVAGQALRDACDDDKLSP